MEGTLLTPELRHSLLERAAPPIAALARANLVREYPQRSVLAMDGPGPVRSHRHRHPAFYGSFDWHSSVEMAWVTARLLRLFPGLPGETASRRVLGQLITVENLAGERATFAESGYLTLERPYGWGWYLTLLAEMATWDDPMAREWTTILTPLGQDFAHRLLEWLPRLSHPQRTGLHPNTAFALSRSLPLARAWAALGCPRLAAGIEAAARRLFERDRDYPAGYEPSAADFLSPALTEAALMAEVGGAEFAGWLESFLPGLGRCRPATLFQPVTVADPADGQLAHFAGLNLSRAEAFVRVAERLGEADRRHRPLLEAAGRHVTAGLPAVVEGDYMVTHWVAAFAVLALS